MDSRGRQCGYCLGRALGSLPSSSWGRLGKLRRRRGLLAGLAGGRVILSAIHRRGSRLLCRSLAAYHEVGHQRSQYRRLSLASRLQKQESLKIAASSRRHQKTAAQAEGNPMLIGDDAQLRSIDAQSGCKRQPLPPKSSST